MSSPHHRPLRLGTRGSPLALAQAGWVARQLREQCGRPAVLVTVATPGDESAAPIERLGTTGVFTTTLRAALLRGAVNVVVHSAKDLPTAPVPGLAGGGVPGPRGPARRADLAGRDKPRHAAARSADRHRVPAASRPAARHRPPAAHRADARQRRHPAAQARRRRGRRPRTGHGGTVAAGRLNAVATPSTPRCSCPPRRRACWPSSAAPTTRLPRRSSRTLDHAPTRAAAIAERAFLAALNAGCSAPVGALAELAAQAGAEPAVRLSGLVAAPDGSSVIRAQATGAVSDGDALGRRLAHILLERGGAALLDRTCGVTDWQSQAG